MGSFAFFFFSNVITRCHQRYKKKVLSIYLFLQAQRERMSIAKGLLQVFTRFNHYLYCSSREREREWTAVTAKRREREGSKNSFIIAPFMGPGRAVSRPMVSVSEQILSSDISFLILWRSGSSRWQQGEWKKYARMLAKIRRNPFETFFFPFVQPTLDEYWPDH